MMRAFDVVPLIPKVEGGKVSCVACWEDNVYVGTEDGNILLYIVERDMPSGKFLFRMDKSRNLGHNRKSVDQLEIMKDIVKLVTLCDGNVDVLNLYTLEPSNTFPVNKNVSLICAEKNTNIFRICVQVKKKLYLFEYTGSFDFDKEINLPESAVNMEFMNGVLCLGFKKSYSLLQVDTQQSHNNNDATEGQESSSLDNAFENTDEMIPLFPLENSIPLITLFMRNNEFLLAKEELGLFISLQGLPSRANIVWKSNVHAIASHTCFSVALDYKSQSIIIHNILTQQMVQTFPFPQGKGLRMVSRTHQNESKYILLATNSVIYALVQQPMQAMVDSLIQRGLMKDAVQLVEYSSMNDPQEVRAQHIGRVNAQAGLALFRQGRLDESTDYLIKSNLDPRYLIQCFPTMLSQNSNFIHNDAAAKQRTLVTDIANQLFTDVSRNTQFLQKSNIYLFKLLNTWLQQQQGQPLLKYDMDTLKDIYTALIKLALEVPDSEFSNLSRKKYTESIIRLAYVTVNSLGTMTPSTANNNNAPTTSFLAPFALGPEPTLGTTPPSPRGNIPKGASVKNILAPTQTTTTLFLLHTNDIENLLIKNNYHNALALVYRFTKQHKKALDIWQTQLSEEGGLEETVKLLQSIDIAESFNNVQFVWNYSKWVLLKDPTMAATIFTTNTTLDYKQVFEFLLQVVEDNTNSNVVLALVIFLEHVIFTMKITETNLATKLALLYVDQVKNQQLSKDQPGSEPDPVGQTRSKLIKLLQSTIQFNENTVLSSIIDSALFEEKIIIYKRLKKHQNSLKIIVEDLKDYARAESYCSECSQDDNTLTFTLFKVYLHQYNNSSPRPGSLRTLPPPALALLNTHAAELNPADVLPLLSDDMPLSSLSDYLRKAMQHNYHTYRMNQIVKQVYRTEDRELKAKMAKIAQKPIIITPEVVCPVCKKQIGDKIFSRYPNGILVHYKCVKDPSVCPVTGTNFRKTKHWEV